MADEEGEVTASTTFMLGDREVDAWGNDVEHDEEVGYNQWTGKQLAAEVDKRNADREEADQIVVEGRKKSDYVAALEADDETYTDEEE